MIFAIRMVLFSAGKLLVCLQLAGAYFGDGAAEGRRNYGVALRCALWAQTKAEARLWRAGPLDCLAMIRV